MNAQKYINQLQDIPVGNKTYHSFNFFKETERLKRDSIAIEVGIATEIAALYGFNELNVNDQLFESYSAQYPRLAEAKSLYDSAVEKTAEGAESMQGLISGLKGKYFEINLEQSLSNTYPGWDFTISENATQPIWDLKGIGPEGEELFIQAKMGGLEYASDVKARMLESPDVMFATSTEIQEKILESSPELASQFIEVDTLNSELTNEVIENTEQLIANFGLDMPDQIGDMLPYGGEIVAGITLLNELSKVKKDFQHIEISDKRRVQGLRAIMAISRFGIGTVSTLFGVSLGTAILPGIGSLIGGVVGGIGSIYFNKKTKTYLFDWALFLMNLSQDEMFYLKNKKAIDDLGQRMHNDRLSLY